MHFHKRNYWNIHTYFRDWLVWQTEFIKKYLIKLNPFQKHFVVCVCIYYIGIQHFTFENFSSCKIHNNNIPLVRNLSSPSYWCMPRGTSCQVQDCLSISYALHFLDEKSNFWEIATPSYQEEIDHHQDLTQGNFQLEGTWKFKKEFVKTHCLEYIHFYVISSKYILFLKSVVFLVV